MDGWWMGGGWEVDAASAASVYGYIIRKHCKTRRAQNLPSRGIPGRFLSLVLISPNPA